MTLANTAQTARDGESDAMPPYAIAVDPVRHTLRVTLHGFWDKATVLSYLADLGTAAARVSRDGAASWWLIDLSVFQVQSQDVAEVLRQTLPSVFPPATTLAVVFDASLTSMQAKRIVPTEHHRHFSRLANAERWLSDQGMPA